MLYEGHTIIRTAAHRFNFYINMQEFLLWLQEFLLFNFYINMQEFLLRTQLASMRMRVRSPASLSGLKIHRCHELLRESPLRLESRVAVAVG